MRWRDLTEEQKAKLETGGFLNGCGPTKLGFISKLIPDSIFFVDAHEPCHHHDFNYLLGGTEADRVKADWQFFEEIWVRAKERCRPWYRRWAKPLYLTCAWIYYRAVRRFGRGSFCYGKIKTKKDIDRLLKKVALPSEETA